MTITDKAVEKAKAILAGEGKEAWGIKIYVAGESCCGPSYGLNLQEEKMPEDEVVEKNGLKVFVVENHKLPQIFFLILKVLNPLIFLD